MSSTRLRSVSSPRPETIALLMAGSTSASVVAWKRVPIKAPAAPSASAAATPRPSAIPPAARTGVGAARSATSGTNGIVDRPRRAPCPPASVPCATMTSAPIRTACLASARSVTWRISAAPARRTGATNALGSPKDNITACGRHVSACSTAATSIAQVRKPTPQGRSVRSATIRSSWSIQSGSPLPPPSTPRPPPLETAAVSAPPADPPIGAEAIGCCTASRSVNAVDNPMTVPGSSPRAVVSVQDGRRCAS